MANTTAQTKTSLLANESRLLIMKCKLCGSNKFDNIYEVEERVIQKCIKCGLVRTEPGELPDYRAYYRDLDYRKYEPRFKNIFQKRFDQINKYKEQGGRVLEIGCSTGLLLEIFKKNGWETWGVEPSGSYKIAQKRIGKVIHKNFETADLPAKYFDAAILNHVFEHLADPVLVLKKIKTILKPGGIVYIDVPNFGSLARKIEQQHWSMFLPHEHVHHFDPVSLNKVVKKAGLETVYEKTSSGVFDVASPVKYYLTPIQEKNLSFIKNALDLPGNLISTVLNMGTNLTLVAQKT